jgi:hypothetical protein
VGSDGAMIGWGDSTWDSPFSRITPSTPQSAAQAGAGDEEKPRVKSVLNHQTNWNKNEKELETSNEVVMK